MVSCLGILREPQNSPNRESDDALILRAAMEELAATGCRTRLISAEEFDNEDVSGWDMLVPMCESYPRLMRLQELQRQNEVLIVNEPNSVLNCYRTRMIPLFKKTGVRFPETEIRKVELSRSLPDFAAQGAWIKRGDVHNTCSYDVVFAGNFSRYEEIRGDFQRREISDVIVQRHIDGDLIKFYGTGPGKWFSWFYHDPATARKLPFALEALAAEAEKAAAATNLLIFGGDAIISPEGSIYVIDINSWPSFARVRKDASVHIARLLHSHLGKRKDLPMERKRS